MPETREAEKTSHVREKRAKGVESSPYLIPGAIIIAGLFIGVAVLYSGGGGERTVATEGNDPSEGESSASTLRPVDETDPIRGNPNAAITIIEYSDFECPFCAQAHPTLLRLTQEFDDVRWVYRHFPLTSIHPQAEPAAIAAECVMRLGGSEAFWDFSDTLFEEQERLGQEFFEETAGSLGIETETFRSCQNDPTTLVAVSDDLNEAVALGGRGTPYSVIVTPSGELAPVSGALPYETFVEILDQVRSQ